MNEQPRKNSGGGVGPLLKSIWVRVVGWGSTISDLVHYVGRRWSQWWRQAGLRLIAKGLARLAVLVIMGILAAGVVNYTYRVYSLRQYSWPSPIEYGEEFGIGETQDNLSEVGDHLAVQPDEEPSNRLSLGPSPQDMFSAGQSYDEEGLEVIAVPGDRTESPLADSTPSISRRPFSPTDTIWPAKGQVTVGYGWIRHPLYRDWRFHPGLELSTPLNSSVQAVTDGRVQRIQSERNRGLVVTIGHEDGWETIYGGLAQLTVGEGDTVQKGQVIGLTGSIDQGESGRLIFEIRKDSIPLEPRTYLP